MDRVSVVDIANFGNLVSHGRRKFSLNLQRTLKPMKPWSYFRDLRQTQTRDKCDVQGSIKLETWLLFFTDRHNVWNFPYFFEFLVIPVRFMLEFWISVLLKWNQMSDNLFAVWYEVRVRGPWGQLSVVSRPVAPSVKVNAEGILDWSLI